MFFHVLACYLFIFFGEVSVQIFCPFFFIELFVLILSSKNYLWIPDTNPLSNMFCKYFIPICGLLFIFVIVFSLKKKKKLLGTSLMFQWLKFLAPNAGSPGSIPVQRTRSHMPQ